MPVLSLDQPIEELEAVRQMEDQHPVYLVAAEDGSHIVIKREDSTNAENIRRNFLTINMASKSSRQVILTADEVNVLKRFCNYRRWWSNTTGAALDTNINVLHHDLYLAGTWFKMAEAKGFLSVKSAASRMLDQDKSGVRAIAKAMNDSGGLEAMGKIVAADMFNQNSDRFLPKAAGKTFIKKADNSEVFFVTKAMSNVGNVMVAVCGGKLKAIGLDSWDPTGVGMYDDIDNPIGPGWLGYILAPDKKAQRLEFAKDICDDLNTLLGPRNRKYAFLQQTRIDSDGPKRLAKGMDTMIKRIIARLELSLKSRASVGMQSRLTTLRGH